MTDTVYRYLDSRHYAEDFVNHGRIMLSTLEICRGYEKIGQGDKGEALQTYYVTKTNSDDDDFHIIQQRLKNSYRVDADCKNIRFENSSVVKKIKDAFILCTATKVDVEIARTFGAHLVEITDPKQLHQRILAAVRKEKIDIRSDRCDLVVYRDQTYRDFEPDLGYIGFGKDPIFTPQFEFRFMYRPVNQQGLNRLLVEVGDLNDICRILPELDIPTPLSN